MSDMTKLSRKRRKRDRTKTHSDVITTLIANRNKRPFDEINTSNSNGFKRRAISATIGSENRDCSIVIIENQEGRKKSKFHFFFF